MDSTEDFLKAQFYSCRKLLTALGDETRQAIIATLISSDCHAGMRVGEIAEKTHLSRPAVSHHLKILLDAAVIAVYPKGTMHFYTMKLGGMWPTMVTLMNKIENLRKESCE
jgi:ArsR family transcriptional regulator